MRSFAIVVIQSIRNISILGFGIEKKQLRLHNNSKYRKEIPVSKVINTPALLPADVQEAQHNNAIYCLLFSLK